MTDNERPAWADEIKREREARGWSKAELGRRLLRAANSYITLDSITKQIRDWEKGKHFPRDWTAAYAEVFEMSAEELFVIPRRNFVSAGIGVMGLAIAGPYINELSAGRRISMSTVHRLRERAARLRNLDDYLGGVDTYRMYLDELHSTQRLAEDASYTETVRQNLMSLMAEQAQQAGWAAYDAGRHGEADRLFGEALESAEESSDQALVGNSLAYRAYQKAMTGQLGVEEACATQEVAAGCHGRVRALLLERAAWSYAVADQPQQVARALDLAAQALADDNGDSPHWAQWVDEVELQIMTGRCWAEMRRPLRAAPPLETALARYDDSHARDKALYLTWLAAAYLDAQEVTRACEVLGRVIELASGVASVRPRKRVEEILTHFRPYRSVPEVADLRDGVRGWLKMPLTA